MEYLRHPAEEEWDLDGKSRLDWLFHQEQECDLTYTKPVIALSGGYIFDSHDSEALAATTNPALDNCDSRATARGMFHYEKWSGCITDFGVPSDFCNNGLCLIGLARNGRLVYGPYDESGAAVTVESRDECNSVPMADGSNAYVQSTTAPYTIGCWPPSRTCDLPAFFWDVAEVWYDHGIGFL